MLTGRHGPKRVHEESLDLVQRRNRTWWEATPMTYDWRRPSSSPFESAAWFDEQDQRFLANAAFYATDVAPFDRFLPYADLRDKDVLEIGVGSGLHAELLARAGAHVTGIDLTGTAMSRTRKRFELEQLTGRFFQWDAENPLPEFEQAFDFVWSWGVHPPLVALGAHRAQRPQLAPSGGCFAGMVYHRDSINAAVSAVRDWVCAARSPPLGGRGVVAGHRRLHGALLFCRELPGLSAGVFRRRVHAHDRAEGEVLPLPRRVRDPLLPRVSDATAHAVLSRFRKLPHVRSETPSRSESRYVRYCRSP